MAIQVLHTPRELFHKVPHFDVEKQIEFVVEHSERYQHVATVNTSNLDDAFRLTNTIHCSWWENDVTTHFKEEGCRSTSVGDVMIDTDTNIQYIVSPIGFTPLVPNNLTLRTKEI